MGSLQKVVKAFLSAFNDTILDRWIPDKDWVCQIQENGKINCSIRNLTLHWQKSVSGKTIMLFYRQTIFYNEKNIQISTAQGTAKKKFLYYDLSAGKPAPTVPSNQGFFPWLWDDLGRSNRSLKQIAQSQ
jgi:hypothetical protein